jgi:TetR/AcrR family transcriptional repressor of bet genes
VLIHKVTSCLSKLKLELQKRILKMHRDVMNSTQTVTRRPYQRATQESRREDLINAALKLIGEGGPQAATVRAIADEAGVTAGLIRHYFNTKEELVRSAYQSLMARLNTESSPIPDTDCDDPIQRLAHFVAASITPPIADPAMVGKWAGFLHLVRSDDDMREVHRENYFVYRDKLQVLIAAAKPSLEGAALRRAAIACNGIIDGLWLEGSLISDSFEPEEIVAVGVNSIGTILGIDLVRAHTP